MSTAKQCFILFEGRRLASKIDGMMPQKEKKGLLGSGVWGQKRAAEGRARERDLKKR